VVSVDGPTGIQHTQRLHDAWGGKKVMAVDCGHMDERSGWIVTTIHPVRSSIVEEAA
jgi:predicted alpha/beta hydrolase family esterase